MKQYDLFSGKLEEKIQEDKIYCSCKNPKTKRSHACVNQKPKEEDMFYICVFCKKEWKRG